MADNDELLAQFQSITGCDPARAQFYLESSNFQIDLAMAAFYEGDQGDEMEGVGGAAAPAGGAASAGLPSADPSPPAPKPAGNKKPTINFPGTMDVSDSDSDEDGQEFYAGGSSHSGNVILGPKKKKEGGKFSVGDMFKAAKDSGAEVVEGGSDGGAGGSGMRAFHGGGFRLGSDTSESKAVGTSSEGATGGPKKGESRQFVLKMWQDGFSLDDGDLRKYDDPANREFLTSVMRGSIPPELAKEAQGGEVHVDMEDHRNEEFVKQTVKAKPFQGSGNVLGSIAPAITPPAASPSSDPAQAEAAAQTAVKFDPSKPTANIQVRLADGSRLVVKLNHSHTVGDLRKYIVTARPQYASTNFTLLTTFPNKELTEESQTLGEANLIGAAVLQRLK